MYTNKVGVEFKLEPIHPKFNKINDIKKERHLKSIEWESQSYSIPFNQTNIKQQLETDKMTRNMTQIIALEANFSNLLL